MRVTTAHMLRRQVSALRAALAAWEAEHDARRAARRAEGTRRWPCAMRSLRAATRARVIAGMESAQ